MFDEQKEPDDIFSEIEPVKGAGGPDVLPGGTPQSLGGPPTGPDGQPLAVEPVPSRGPSKFLFVAIAIIVIGLIGGGVWYFVLRDSGETNGATEPDGTAQEQPTPDPEDVVPPEPDIPDATNCGNGTCEPGEEIVCPEDCLPPEELLCGNGICDAEETFDDCPIDCPPEPIEPVTDPEPANQPLDSDGDGLSDDDERARGTNPQSADTDADGLSDREEVMIYETDPTNPDTDGDTFLDGDEVKSGYNPNGDGRLLNVPQ